MANFTKFLAIGAIALGFAQYSNAANFDNTHIKDIKSQISQSISQSIKKQFDMGILTEKAHVNINIMDEDDIAKTKETDNNLNINSNLSISQSTLNNNISHINNECVINVVYIEDGNIPNISNFHTIIEVTKFQNDIQKTIAQKFVVLHEHHHCEFININQPIIAFGQNAKFNQEINFLLKGQANMAEKSSYYHMLSENYADVSAALSLIKEYGSNNPDLKFVLKALNTQRHANYLVHATDSHSTHFSLEGIMSNDNMAKLHTINNATSFRNLALDISNKGVQSVFVEQPELTNMITSEENIVFSVQSNLAREIFKQSLSEQELKTFPVDYKGKGAGKGFTEIIADQAISLYDLSGLKEERAKNNSNIDIAAYNEFTKRVYNNMEKDLGSKDYKELQSKITYSISQLKVFTSTFPKLENSNEINFPFKVTKGSMLDKIGQLRKQFIEKTSDNSNKYGL